MGEQNIVLVKASIVVFDEDGYVRGSVNEHHVTELAGALASGAVLPPIGLRAGSNRLIYGRHRLLAYIRVYGEDAEVVRAIYHDIDDRGAFEMAIRENASHGLRFSPWDVARITIMAARHNIDGNRLSSLLSIPIVRLQTLSKRRGYKTVDAAGNPGDPVALKAFMRGYSGEVLTPAQVETNVRGVGWDTERAVRDLTRKLETGAYDRTRETLRLALLRHRAVVDALDLDTPWVMGDVG